MMVGGMKPEGMRGERQSEDRVTLWITYFIIACSSTQENETHHSLYNTTCARFHQNVGPNEKLHH